MDRRYYSRKFSLAAFVLLATLVLLLFGVITPELWERMSVYTLGLYMAGNVGDTVAEAIKK